MYKFKFWLLVFIIPAIQVESYSCTNILVTSGASNNNSNMITYAADSHVLYGELYHWPAEGYGDNDSLDIYEWDTGKFLGTIKQAKRTYNVVGNINEFQVAIGETTFTGRKELQDTTGIMDYGSLMYIALQRSKTAREAIDVMTGLVDEYGYYSTGESFSISDKNEVWIMEMIGKGVGNKGAVWVARRIPDGYISAHANQARIQTFPQNDPENCLYAEDVIDFAREKGWYKGKDKDFSFSDTYAPVDFGGARFCEARVWAIFNRVSEGMDKYLDYAKGENLDNRMPLWIKPDKKLGTRDVMELMRDYYQGTELDMTKDVGAGPYDCIVRWRPLTWYVDSVEYFNERAISTQQTGFSFVAQSRKELPDPIGGILWFGVDDTYSTVYTPMYCSITKVPEPFAVGNGSLMEFSANSAFWIFNQVSNFAYTRYSLMIPEIRKVQGELEKTYISFTPAVDMAAEQLIQNEGIESARSFITKYSVDQGNRTFLTWKRLYEHLFTKYMDGNVKYKVEGQQNPEYEQPGYSNEWYKRLIEETGDKFRYLEVH